MIAYNDEVYLMERIYRENKNLKGLQHLVVWFKKITKDEYERFHCVVYSNLRPDTKDQLFKLPHKTSKTLKAPDIRT